MTYKEKKSFTFYLENTLKCYFVFLSLLDTNIVVFLRRRIELIPRRIESQREMDREIEKSSRRKILMAKESIASLSEYPFYDSLVK